MLESYEQLKQMILAAEEDVRRAAGGNKAAGTRVRKLMQDIKAQSQALRVRILENRDAGEGPSGAGDPGAVNL